MNIENQAINVTFLALSTGVVLQPGDANQSHHHVEISFTVAGVGRQAGPAGTTAYITAFPEQHRTIHTHGFELWFD